MNARERLAEANPDAITYDGFEDCLIGYVERFGMEPVALYDREKCIKNLMARGLTHEEAEEFFGFNVIGGWNGDATPCFATLA